MIAKMRTQEKYKDAFWELESHFTEQVNNKVVKGHVMRHYDDIVEKLITAGIFMEMSAYDV